MRVPGVMLRDRIVLEAFTGRTGAGVPAFAAAVTVKAHVEPKRRVVRTPDGEQTVSTAVAWARPDVDAPARSKVTWNGQVFSVLAHGVLRGAVLELVLGGAGEGAS